METASTFHIKNMVCRRCILIVENILASLQIEKAGVSLGKITIPYDLAVNRQQALTEKLFNVGLEIIEGRIDQLVEDVKQRVREYLAMGIDAKQKKECHCSDYIHIPLNDVTSTALPLLLLPNPMHRFPKFLYRQAA